MICRSVTAQPSCRLAGPLHLSDVIAAHPVALIGTAAPSAYGESIAAHLAKTLHRQRVPLISSAAFGIPRAVLQSVLDDRGAPVAVLAGGLDRAFPAANRDLLRTIGRAGLLVTSAASGASPSRAGFIERNRLLAALAAATVVVEAGIRSGALNTVSWARLAGRPVGAVPGPVTSPASSGCHRLLGEGVAVITDAVVSVPARL